MSNKNKMSYESMMEVLEKYGHVLDTRETIVFSNLATGHRTVGQLSTFLNIPKVFVTTTATRAREKIRSACMQDIKKLGATDEMIEEIQSHLT
jgi:hypothetical protein